MNQNILFSAADIAQTGVMDDYCQDTGVTPIMQDGFPLSNLLLPNLWQAAKFATNAGVNTQFVVNLGSIQPISFIALLKHNVISGGHWSVQIYDTLANYQGPSPIYDSGVVPMIPVFSSFGTLPWGVFAWGEATSEADLANYNRNAYMPLSDVVLGQYISITIFADTNPAPVQAFRCWIGTYYQPTFNMDYGSALEPIDETSVKKGFKGARTYGDPVKRRQLKISITSLPQGELLSNVYGPMFLRNGVSEPMIVMAFPQDSSKWMTTSIYGNLQPQNPNDLSFVSWNQMAVTMTVEENV